MMNRRSEDISGCVNFPIDNPAFKNTMQGGMFVKLVVVDDFDTQDERAFAKCSGSYVCDLQTESFVGDDRHEHPDLSPYKNDDDVIREGELCSEWEERHFPNIRNQGDLGMERYISRPYLASIVLGSTGWSGWDVKQEKNWSCTYQDLSVFGQTLYDQLLSLYPHATLHLLTFLDT